MCTWRDSCHTWMSHDHVYVYVCDMTQVTYEWVPTICMSMCVSICVTWLMSQMNQSWLCVCLCVWHDSCHIWVSRNYVYIYVCDVTHVTYEWVTTMCMSMCVTWLMSSMRQSQLCVCLCVWHDSCHIWMNHDYMCIPMCVTWLSSYMNESRCMRHYMTMCHVLQTNSVKYEVLSHV